MVKRIVDGEESSHKNTAVLKDKNFLRLKKDQKCIMFQQNDIE